MEGEHRDLDTEAHKHATEDEQGCAGRDACCQFRQDAHVERMHELSADLDRIRQEIQRKEGDDHERRTKQRVEEELERGILTLLATPDADHEVHRQKDNLEEDKEQDEILRDKRSEHSGFQNEDQDEERFRVLRLRKVIPGIDDAQRHDEQREGNHRQRDAVDAHDVPTVNDRNPCLVDDELQATARVVVEVGHEQDSNEPDHEACRECDHLVELLFGLRHDQHGERSHKGEEHHKADTPTVQEIFHRIVLGS
ncbi:unannotated protein [freshwater metagenome]|uniref:Unannotated protein n=1 Tax=freshwater metagenome TaxID=449393 RepID=A0A6J6WN94_9ZZZZ